jgi:hypothetical protein
VRELLVLFNLQVFQCKLFSPLASRILFQASFGYGNGGRICILLVFYLIVVIAKILRVSY